jgi:MFS family permease
MGIITETAAPPSKPLIAPAPAWRWVHVGVAALAMVATLPGRTQGLGLFTEPILNAMRLDRESYGFLNLCATVLGGFFCLPCGWLIDRLGTRAVLTGVMIALGSVVIAISQVQGAWPSPITVEIPGGGASFSAVLLIDLFLFVLLTRGLGQSALSVASLSLIGRSAARRTGLAMGVYGCLTSLGFVGAFTILGFTVVPHPEHWRATWAGIGLGVILAGVLSAILVRNQFLDADAKYTRDGASHESSATLGRALLTPAFWTFSLATSFYGMVAAGISLYNQSLLAERGFDAGVFRNVTLIGIPVGLGSNLLCGWLATRWPLERLLAAAMALLAVTLFLFPYVRSEPVVYAYAASLAVAGGAITVCFFTVWRRGFGPAHLGRIQGAAQMLTVLFSAFGQQLFASVKVRLDAYLPLFPWLGACAFLLAIAAWPARLPDRRAARVSNGE